MAAPAIPCFPRPGGPSVNKPAINPWVIALTVTLATFMELLDTSIANVSLPYIAGGLGRSYDEVTWILTTYLVANAVVLPMSAWLSRGAGPQELLPGLRCAVHDHIALLRARSQPWHHAAGAGTAGYWRRRAGTGGAGDSGRYVSAA